MEFQNRTVIITGASAGIGEACAEAFADLGANLVLLARGEQALQQLAERLSEKTQVLARAMDVDDTSAYEALLADAVAQFGQINVLVNNAGCHHRGPFAERSIDELTQMVNVNLRAPVLLSRLSLPYLQQSDGAAIVNVASLAGRSPLNGAVIYSSTKFGLRAFSLALAAELADTRVHVGLVSPGPVDTGFIMEEIDEVADIVFSQPMSTAAEVAAAVVEVAAGKRLEIAMPRASGRLAHIGYLFPRLNRRLKPWLDRQGRRNKQRYKQRSG